LRLVFRLNLEAIRTPALVRWATDGVGPRCLVAAVSFY